MRVTGNRLLTYKGSLLKPETFSIFWDLLGKAYKSPRHSILILQSALTAPSAQTHLPAKRQVIGGTNPKAVNTQAPELRSQEARFSQVLVSMTAAKPLTHAELLLFPRSLRVLYRSYNTITKALHTELQNQYSTAWSSFPFLGQNHFTTPKTPERSVSKGRLCFWVHAPGPWTAMGTVCKQPRTCTFYIL